MNNFLTMITSAQYLLAEICIVALVGILLFGIFSIAHNTLRDKFFKNRNISGLEKLFITLGVCAITQYAATKHFIADGKNVGAQSSILLDSIDVSYDVETSNNVFKICWTNSISSIPLNTSVCFRDATSNDWMKILIPLSAVLSSNEDNPNEHYLEFTYKGTTNNLSGIRFWWVGEDRPGIETLIISEELFITVFDHSSEHIYLEWETYEDIEDMIIDDPEILHYTVQFSDDNGISWVDVADTNTTSALIPGFWYGKDRIWRIVFEYSTEDVQ